MANILLIEGPNLNLLGERQPELYGYLTSDQIKSKLQQDAVIWQHDLAFFQSNHEGDLIDRIHQAQQEQIDLIIINAGAYSHTSIALRDALLAGSIPHIEVHLTNLAQREPYRQFSYLADIAIGTIGGFGSHGYRLALNAAEHFLETQLENRTQYGHSQNQETH